jgi:hypothetical protein
MGGGIIYKVGRKYESVKWRLIGDVRRRKRERVCNGGGSQDGMVNFVRAGGACGL